MKPPLPLLTVLTVGCVLGYAAGGLFRAEERTTAPVAESDDTAAGSAGERAEPVLPPELKQRLLR
jgi:hypothetical protein